MSRYENEPGLTAGTLITDTVALTGNFCAILIVEATVFTTLTGTIALQGAWASATFAPKQVIRGNFTEVKLASGAVIVYNAR